MKKIGLLLVAFIVTACATPSTILRNDKTGQIARCGGDATGSMMGGMIGYNIQKDNDEKCVRDYEAQGFKKIQ
jgi:uncharacterized lipoprotein YajG